MTQARQVRQGESTPLALVEEAIDRIEALDGQLGAVVHRRFEAARSEAGAPLPDGPFRGVPLLVKDAVCHAAGDPYHLGMRLLRDRDWHEDDDTYLAARFRQAGFVVVGRTNTPELATAFTTEPAAYGPTRNPWDPSRSAGGSSGGSAAAVAAGMTAVAHGNDMGGSVRVPASECGVIGLKPSRGRISLGPQFGEYWSILGHEGLLTRTVRDLAAVLDAVAGPEPGDLHPAPAPTRPFSLEATAEPAALRVGLLTTVPMAGVPAHPDCVAAAEAAGRSLQSCGHRVEPVGRPVLDDAALSGPFLDVFSVSVARDLDRWGARLGVSIGPDDVEPRNWLLAERGRQVEATGYVASLEALHTYRRRIAAWWETDIDLLLTPTIPEPPPEIGRLPWRPKLAEVADLGQFASPFNVTGQPAISLPTHQSADGLPVGVQLVAAYGREDLLLGVAAQLEQVAPWDRRHPAVSAWSRALADSGSARRGEARIGTPSRRAANPVDGSGPTAQGATEPW
jgi:amidase